MSFPDADEGRLLSVAGFTVNPMGNIYREPAHVILDNGGEIPVTADLRTFMDGLRTDWSGVLAAAPENRVVLANNASGRLRVKDGRESAFVCLDPSTWVTTGKASIQGNGDAPF